MHPNIEPDIQAELVAKLTASQNAIAVTVRALIPGESGVDEVIQQINAKFWQQRTHEQTTARLGFTQSSHLCLSLFLYGSLSQRFQRLIQRDELRRLGTSLLSARTPF